MESSAARAGGGQALSQPDQDRQRALADKMQTVAMELQGIEGELQAAVEVRQRLDSQLTENEQVKKEFAVLKADDAVYKLVGPALLKQEQEEAKANVDKRIEYIQSEIKRVEKQLQEVNERSEKKRLEVLSIQQSAQQAQGQGGRGPQPATATA